MIQFGKSLGEAWQGGQDAGGIASAEACKLFRPHGSGLVHQQDFASRTLPGSIRMIDEPCCNTILPEGLREVVQQERLAGSGRASEQG